MVFLWSGVEWFGFIVTGLATSVGFFLITLGRGFK